MGGGERSAEDVRASGRTDEGEVLAGDVNVLDGRGNSGAGG